MKKAFFSLLFFSLVTLQAQQLPLLDFRLVASGLTRPTDITHAGDERLFVLEQAGRIRILDSSRQLLSTPFLDIRTIVKDTRNEQGLLGIAFHPDYASNGFFYLNYTDNNGATQVSRFTRDSTNIQLADPNSELKMLNISQPFTNHNGGQLAFGPDGYLYISTGDGGSGGDPQNNSQNRLSLLGKMLRLEVDGALPYGIPADNPFVNDPATRDEIWALGLRNPWRFSFDPLNGDLWIADVGQDATEELSRQPGGSQGGENYGWRCYEGSDPFQTNGCSSFGNYASPLFEYDNSLNFGESVTGGFVYRGQDHPGMYGYYIFADYETGNFWLTLADSLMGFPTTIQRLGVFNKGISSFGRDHRGELYVADLANGRILQIFDKRTGIDAGNLSDIAQISPNPFSDFFRIQFKSPQSQVEVQLWDLSGKLLFAQKETHIRDMRIDRNELAAGVYVLEIKSNEKSFRGKIIAR